MTRAALLLLALIGPLTAQQIQFEVTLAGGTVLATQSFGDPVVLDHQLTMGVRQIKAGHWRCWIRNDGRPTYPGLPGDPILIDHADAWLPAGWSILDAPQIGVADAGGGHWRLVHPETVRPSHSQVPGSSLHVLIAGGHQTWWDAVAPGVEAYPVPDRFSPIADRAREFLGMSTVRTNSNLTDSPFNAELRNLKSFWAWGGPTYTLDEWIMNRFGGRIPWMGSPAWWGGIPWADRWCNHHYDLVSAALEGWLYGVPGSWEMATIMARQHFQFGIHDSQGHPYSLMHVYEKTGGDQKYPGDNAIPRDSHEWDFGILVWALVSGDPAALEIMNRRADALEGWAQDPALVWNGAGGSRQLGWFVRNCRAFTHLSVRDMRSSMANVIDHAISVNEGLPYWRNLYTSGGVAPWMDAITNVELLTAIEAYFHEHPQFVTWQGNVHEKIMWQIQRLVEWDPVTHQVRIPYGYNVITGQRTFIYETEQLAWAIPQLWIAAQVDASLWPVLIDARDQFANDVHYDFQAAISGGSAAVKTWGSAHQWATREVMWR